MPEKCPIAQQHWLSQQKILLTFTDKESTYNIGPIQSLDVNSEITVVPQTLHLQFEKWHRSILSTFLFAVI